MNSFISTKLGLEPCDRIRIWVLELVSSPLIFIPRTTVYGAILGTGLMSGATFSHLTKFGIVVQDEGG